MAMDLATDPEKLQAIKQKLAEHRLTEPLFNTEKFARDIENLYTQMYERYQNNLGVDSIRVV